jgi:pyruvate-formate lyase-activating enzyme
MNFGYVSTSFVDSPNGTASVVFFDECNMSCSYCHQKRLLENGGEFSLGQVIDKIQANKFNSGKPRTDWLILSGGEPTMFPEIVSALSEIGRSTGRKVGMWTNFVLPGAAELAMNRLDWVNVDYKWFFHQYPKESFIVDNLIKIYLNKPEMFRLTTVVDGKVDGAYLKAMGELFVQEVVEPCNLRNRITWRFAPFRVPPDGSLLGSIDEHSAPSMAELQKKVECIGFGGLFEKIVDGHD